MTDHNLIYVYRCNSCGTVFYGKKPRKLFKRFNYQKIHKYAPYYITHRCYMKGENLHGVAELIACKVSRILL